MLNRNRDLELLLDEISASSAGGAPFLIAFGASLLVCAALALVLPAKVLAIVVLFQGNVALPLAFLLERRMGAGPMRADHPMKSLSILMAMTQVVALPAVITAYAFHPWLVPAAMAAVGGGHFLPYAWMHRTRVYTVLGVAVSLGSFALTLALRGSCMPWVLLYLSAAYAVAAVLVRRHAAPFVSRARARAGISVPAAGA